MFLRLTLLASFLAQAACVEPVKELAPGELCDDVAYSISSRTFACTGDAKLANERFERFRRSTTCTGGGAYEIYYRCPVAIEAMDCPSVLAAGETFSEWLRVSPHCAEFVTVGGGS